MNKIVFCEVRLYLHFRSFGHFVFLTAMGDTTHERNYGSPVLCAAYHSLTINFITPESMKLSNFAKLIKDQLCNWRN